MQIAPAPLAMQDKLVEILNQFYHFFANLIVVSLFHLNKLKRNISLCTDKFKWFFFISLKRHLQEIYNRKINWNVTNDEYFKSKAFQLSLFGQLSFRIMQLSFIPSKMKWSIYIDSRKHQGVFLVFENKTKQTNNESPTTLTQNNIVNIASILTMSATIEIKHHLGPG